MTQGLGLNETDDTPIVARGARLVSRGDLKRRADALLRQLRARKVSRALVCSDNPVDILRAIDACHRAGCDLFIAHTNLPATHVDEIVQSYGVTLRIGENDEAVASTVQGEAPSARIFMMTSGTTGRPKIASHSLESLLARVRAGLRQGSASASKWLLLKACSWRAVKASICSASRPCRACGTSLATWLALKAANSAFVNICNWLRSKVATWDRLRALMWLAPKAAH